jgi:serine/threonine protein kinase
VWTAHAVSLLRELNRDKDLQAHGRLLLPGCPSPADRHDYRVAVLESATQARYNPRELAVKLPRGAVAPRLSAPIQKFNHMPEHAANRDLLFALTALQNGLINQAQLVAAFQAWTLAKAVSLADHLEHMGHLNAEGRSAIDALVALHLKRNGGSTEKSLADFQAGRSTREALAEVHDPDVDATLALVGSSSDLPPGGISDFTASYAVGGGEANSGAERFRVLRPHAQGGLGAVYVALDSELNREVALKRILDPHADDPNSRQRFLLEAQVTGGLEHPGIVPVYGLGVYKSGRPYYAMRFIKGDSLKQAIERFHRDADLRNDPGRRSLEMRHLLRRFTDVCNAIAYAHSRGVLHRDIKPSNVIIGKYGETLVVDWGLAKALGHSEPNSALPERTLLPLSGNGKAETLAGSALGTPAYMSPEQASGDMHRLGPRSDVYSLGATLYCLLTGRPPFDGDAGAVLAAVQDGRFLPGRSIVQLTRPSKPFARRRWPRFPSSVMPRAANLPTTSTGGWPMNLSRRGARHWPSKRGAGCADGAPSSPRWPPLPRWRSPASPSCSPCRRRPIVISWPPTAD